MRYFTTKCGDSVSVLGFGGMRFPQKGGRVDVEQTYALLRKAVDLGVNYFDTAYFYHMGKSEAYIGEALKGVREKVFIADKLPPFLVSDLKSAQKVFSKQLERLKTTYIDYYLFHMLSNIETFDRMVKTGVIAWLEDLKKQGVIRNIGFSFHGGKTDFEKLIEAYPWDICQIQYNYVDENIQAGKSGLQLAHSRGVPVVVMEPLKGGVLVDLLPKAAKDVFESAPQKRTAADWALAWLWNQKEVSVVLSGMSSIEQLEQNVACSHECRADMLSEEEAAVIGRVKDIINEKTKVPCTACNYCMPCPAGVNIPGCFASYNAKYLISGRIGMQQYMQELGATTKKPAVASKCIGCGKCEQHCPQSIKIREELKAVKKEMEPWWWAAGMGIARMLIK